MPIRRRILIAIVVTVTAAALVAVGLQMFGTRHVDAPPDAIIEALKEHDLEFSPALESDQAKVISEKRARELSDSSLAIWVRHDAELVYLGRLTGLDAHRDIANDLYYAAKVFGVAEPPAPQRPRPYVSLVEATRGNENSMVPMFGD